MEFARSEDAAAAIEQLDRSEVIGRCCVLCATQCIAPRFVSHDRRLHLGMFAFPVCGMAG